ncbi:MAG: ankyrin repeat domain-containing protein [Verrucomicrobiales bacterium]|nr:ankyrin repeat domain-containing protein [Verrucomicrobiales bacterium]
MTRLLLVVFVLAVFGLTVKGSEPPFIQAAYEDQTELVAQLIEDGSDVNQTNDYGVAALSLACQNGNAKIVKMLLEAGADPDTSLKGGETALMTAARTGRPEPVALLLSHGAEVEAKDWKQQCALMWAVAEGHKEVAGILLKAGADPERTLKSGFTPLFFAARNGHREVVELLLSFGVDPTIASANETKARKGISKGTTALRLAVENGHFETAITLLDAGVDPGDEQSGHSPLHVLSWVRKPNRGDGEDGLPPPAIKGDLTTLDFARLLVKKYDAEVDQPISNRSTAGPKFGTRGATPLLLACRTVDLPYLKLLHELGANLEATDQEGSTALLTAAGVGSRNPEEEAGVESEAIEMVRWLLERGAGVNAVNRNRETAMHGAAYRNWPKMVNLLAEAGADIEIWNQSNKRRWTPLLIAQGFRPGNFKPSAATEEAIAFVMKANGFAPPSAPERPIVGKPKAYEP